MKRKDIEALTWRELVDGQVPELEKYFPETLWYYNEAGDEEWSSHFFKKERREILKQLVF